MNPAGGPPALALAPLLGDPTHAGLFCDFDGTLAPIVDDPATARPEPGAVAALGRLARRLGVVAVVSGRPAGFLLEGVGALSGVRLFGLHGLESVRDGSVVVMPSAGPWLPTVAAVARRAARELGPAAVEDKGVALTLHYRRAPEEAERVRDWAAAEAAATGLVGHPARRSVELRPPVPHGKGAVVERLSSGLTAAAFCGDDAGDLDAFAALDQLAKRGVATVRVAVSTDEAPAELVERADVVVGSVGAVVSLLADLAAALEG